MLNTLFILNNSGNIIIERHYKGIINRTIGDLFFNEVKKYGNKPEETPTSIATSDYYLIHVFKFNLFFVAVLKEETNPLLIVELLLKIVDTFQKYFGKVDENSIKSNFTTVYQLLDEMIDDGFPITTEMSLLMDLVKPPEDIVDNLKKAFTQIPGNGRSPVPWRKLGIKYVNNEIFFDIFEEVNAIIDNNGAITICEVVGKILVNCRLSGMPDLLLQFKDPNIFDDISFHPCVRYSKFELDKVISFVPPDGEFELLSYRISDINQLPIYVRPQVSFYNGEMNIQCMVGLKHNVSGSNLLNNNNVSVKSLEKGVDELKVIFPVDNIFANENSKPVVLDNFNVASCTFGNCLYDAISNNVIWNVGCIGSKENQGSQNNLKTTLPKTPSLSVKGSVSKDALSPSSVFVSFILPASPLSNIAVDSVELKNEKYKPFKGVRYVTRTKKFEIRTENARKGKGKEKEKIKEQEKLKKKFFINSWYDPLASICSTSECMCLGDLNGDGDHKLICISNKFNPLSKIKYSNQAEFENQGGNIMKIFTGISMIGELVLLEESVGIVSFYQEIKTKKPVLGVASGSFVFIYRNLQPFYRFQLPEISFSNEEKEIWNGLQNDQKNPSDAFNELINLRNEGKKLTSRSREMLSLSNKNEIIDFVKEKKNKPLKFNDIITCISVIKKSSAEDFGEGCVVIGTEDKKVHIFNSSCSSITDSIELTSVPHQIECIGTLDVESRIIVSTRSGNVYQIRNKKLSGVTFELETSCIGISIIDKKNIVVATMSNLVHVFNPKGKKNFTIYLNDAIKLISALHLKSTISLNLLAVALDNFEMRIYNGKNMIDKIKLVDDVIGMRFGTYGTESNTLIISYRNGAIDIKNISRKANFEVQKYAGPPKEQLEELDLPKKTKLFKDLMEREQQHAIEMHRIFQRELTKLRLTTSRTYVKLLTDGEGVSSYGQSNNIIINADIQGIGPKYKIKVSLQNTSNKTIIKLPVVFFCNDEIFKLGKSKITVPALIPNLLYKFSVDLENISTDLKTDIIKIFICKKNSNVPLITAILNIPIPENF